jgi:hypothetical protein
VASYTQYATGNARLNDNIFVVYVVDSVRLVLPFIQARVLSGNRDNKKCRCDVARA